MKSVLGKFRDQGLIQACAKNYTMLTLENVNPAISSASWPCPKLANLLIEVVSTNNIFKMVSLCINIYERINMLFFL